MSEKLLFGKIVGVHGIKGFVKIQFYTESPDSLTAYGPLSNQKGDHFYDIEVKNQKKNIVIAFIEGVTDRNHAESLIGEKLFLEEDKLPDPDEDEFYHKDLVGLKVLDEDKNEIGKILSIANYGAGDVLEIDFGEKQSELIPFHKNYVLDVQLDQNHVIIKRPEYLETDKEA